MHTRATGAEPGKAWRIFFFTAIFFLQMIVGVLRLLRSLISRDGGHVYERLSRFFSRSTRLRSSRLSSKLIPPNYGNGENSRFSRTIPRANVALGKFSNYSDAFDPPYRAISSPSLSLLHSLFLISSVSSLGLTERRRNFTFHGPLKFLAGESLARDPH